VEKQGKFKLFILLPKRKRTYF